jgi:RND superfamily putative drug exporter
MNSLECSPILAGRGRPYRRTCAPSIFLSRRAPSGNRNPHREAAKREKFPQELDTRFRSPFVDRVVLVIQGIPPADSEEGEQALGTIEERLQKEPGVSGVVSHLDFAIRFSWAREEELLFWWDSPRPRGPWNRSSLSFTIWRTRFKTNCAGRYPAIKLELTGETPLNFDIRKASADDVQHAETLVIPATLILLLVAFGSVVAALIPLGTGQLAIATALAIAGFLAMRWHLSILVQSSGHHAWPGVGNRLRAAHGQPLPRSDSQAEPTDLRLVHRGVVRQATRC